MKQAKHITIAGCLLAAGLLLPMIFHTFGLGGPVFLPMHLPVLLGGFLLPAPLALLLGAALPLLSSVLTGMPVLFPMGIQMIFELGAYGLIISLIYRRGRSSVFLSLVIGMILGRIVAGAANYLIFSLALGVPFKLNVFLTASFVTALPGILLQLILIPVMVKVLQRRI